MSSAHWDQEKRVEACGVGDVVVDRLDVVRNDKMMVMVRGGVRGV